MAAAGLLALGVLVELFLVLYLGIAVFRLDPTQLQTLVFTMLVFSGQATVYLVRVRRHLWTARPSNLLMIASAGDVAVVVLLATRGILMAPVALPTVMTALGVTVLFMLLMDPMKAVVFRRLGLG